MSVKQTEEHPEEQLWKQLDDVRAGMLGVEDSHSHMQPMGHMTDRENAKLWFFTSRAGDLFKEIGAGKRAHFCVVGKKHDYHACLSGMLSESRNRAKIDELWSDITGAWFNGKDDPDLALLSFDLDDAAIWASTKNPVKFAWEIQRSKNSDREPDVGARAHVEFAGGRAVHESSSKK